MDINTAILQRRTIRRFQNKPIDREILLKLVELSRLYASGGNLQPICYAVVQTQQLLDSFFDTLRWAAYLPGFEIKADEHPMAYVILMNGEKSKRNIQFDVGAAATTLMLAAEGYGLASCCLGSFDKAKVAELLHLSDQQEPLLVIALGYPAQKSRVVDMTDDVKYYEDETGCLCVPKRTLSELLTEH